MRFTITKKIAFPFAIILILMIVSGIISILELSNAQKSLLLLTKETQKEKTLTRLQSYVASLLITSDNFIITGEKRYSNDYDNFKRMIETQISKLDLLLTTSGEQQELNDIKKNIDSIYAVIPGLFNAARGNASDSIDLLIKKLDYKFDDNINKDISGFISSVQEKVKEYDTRVNRERKEAFVVTAITALLAFIIAVIVVILTLKYISKPILKLIGIAQRIAARDFTVELHTEGKDEIAMLIIAFNAMVDEIGKRYEELENFSYIAAHDLKSPLTGIIGSAEILLTEYEGRISPENEQALRNIISSGKMMASLINDLLEFAAAGKIEYSKEPASMNEMLNRVKTQLNYMIKQKNAKLLIQENLPSLLCDPVRFSQIWSNLISNSIKYNDSPEPQIEIGTVDKKYANQYCFFVKDNGIGIEEIYLEKIFNPFQRATNNKKYEGTGIGLAIVKRIIEFHKGRIWAESKVGTGTTFYFTIPKQQILENKISS